MTVDCVEEEEEESYERRTFKVSVGDKERTIVQFQYTNWVRILSTLLVF